LFFSNSTSKSVVTTQPSSRTIPKICCTTTSNEKRKTGFEYNVYNENYCPGPL
jgi:hypothetical protein